MTFAIVQASAIRRGDKIQIEAGSLFEVTDVEWEAEPGGTIVVMTLLGASLPPITKRVPAAAALHKLIS